MNRQPGRRVVRRPTQPDRISTPIRMAKEHHTETRLRSNTPRAFRSTSLDASQAFPRHGAALNHGRTASNAWKVRLTSTAGLPLDPEAQQKMKVLEILKPAWWLESYSRLIHAIQDFGVDDTSAEESNIYHRVGVSRASDRIPRYTPYNFGISPQ
ncbi:hypothetical protein B0H13DRAFT_1851440 [Mycena leptocephala]|nr:hypothetical protein B0H13DRAFT_1851440 [Mycena leptocephala]